MQDGRTDERTLLQFKRQLTLVLIERNSWKRQVHVQDKLCKERLSHAIQEMCCELVIALLHNMNATAPDSLIPILDPQTSRTPSPTPLHLTLLYQHALPEPAWGGERGSTVHASHKCPFHGFWFCFLWGSSWATANNAQWFLLAQCSELTPEVFLRS